MMRAPRLGFLQVMMKNTGWLYAAETLPRLTALLIMPIWSARIAPEEYARWILAFTSAELLLGIGSLGLTSFLVKVLYRYHDERAQQYFGMGAMVILIATGLGAAAMAACSPWLSRVVIGGEVRADLFVFVGLYVLLAQVTNLAILYLSTLVQYKRYFVLMLCRWFFTNGLFLFFLLIRRQGFYSWVWAVVGTEALLAPVAAYHLRQIWGKWAARRMVRFAFRFSVPAWITSFLVSGQSRVGRYLLSFAGVSAGLGHYGIAQTLATSYGAVVRPTKLVAQQLVGHALEADAESPYFLEFFHGFASVALIIAFLVALWLGDVSKLFVSSSYWAAAAALPALVFTAHLEEIFSLYQSLMFRYFKVWFNFFGSLIAFPLVIATTILLVPQLGFLGAALAQLAGAVATVVFAQLYASKVSWRPFRFGEKMAFILAAFCLVSAAHHWAFSIPSKILLALTALGGYGVFHWRRREELFPLAVGRLRGIVCRDVGAVKLLEEAP